MNLIGLMIKYRLFPLVSRIERHARIAPNRYITSFFALEFEVINHQVDLFATMMLVI